MSPKASKRNTRKMHQSRGHWKQPHPLKPSSELVVNDNYRADKAEWLSSEWWFKGNPPTHMTRTFRVELKKPLFDREIRERLHNAFGDLNEH